MHSLSWIGQAIGLSTILLACTVAAAQLPDRPDQVPSEARASIPWDVVPQISDDHLHSLYESAIAESQPIPPRVFQNGGIRQIRRQVGSRIPRPFLNRVEAAWNTGDIVNIGDHTNLPEQTDIEFELEPETVVPAEEIPVIEYPNPLPYKFMTVEPVRFKGESSKPNPELESTIQTQPEPPSVMRQRYPAAGANPSGQSPNQPSVTKTTEPSPPQNNSQTSPVELNSNDFVPRSEPTKPFTPELQRRHPIEIRQKRALLGEPEFIQGSGSRQEVLTRPSQQPSLKGLPLKEPVSTFPNPPQIQMETPLEVPNRPSTGLPPKPDFKNITLPPLDSVRKPVRQRSQDVWDPELPESGPISIPGRNPPLETSPKVESNFGPKTNPNLTENTREKVRQFLESHGLKAPGNSTSLLQPQSSLPETGLSNSNENRLDSIDEPYASSSRPLNLTAPPLPNTSTNPFRPSNDLGPAPNPINTPNQRFQFKQPDASPRVELERSDPLAQPEIPMQRQIEPPIELAEPNFGPALDNSDSPPASDWTNSTIPRPSMDTEIQINGNARELGTIRSDENPLSDEAASLPMMVSPRADSDPMPERVLNPVPRYPNTRLNDTDRDSPGTESGHHHNLKRLGVPEERTPNFKRLKSPVKFEQHNRAFSSNETGDSEKLTKFMEWIEEPADLRLVTARQAQHFDVIQIPTFEPTSVTPADTFVEWNEQPGDKLLVTRAEETRNGTIRYEVDFDNDVAPLVEHRELNQQRVPNGANGSNEFQFDLNLNSTPGRTARRRPASHPVDVRR